MICITFQISTFRTCTDDLKNYFHERSKLKELILRNSKFFNFRESIPGSPLFVNIHTLDITNTEIFLSQTSFERMCLIDHILMQKKDNPKCQIKDIVTDRPPTYEFKHLGVNISRAPGASTQLSEFPELYVPDDTAKETPVESEESSCVSNIINCLNNLQFLFYFKLFHS